MKRSIRKATDLVRLSLGLYLELASSAWSLLPGRRQPA